MKYMEGKERKVDKGRDKLNNTVIFLDAAW